MSGTGESGLMSFEPENDLERALLRAQQGKAAVPEVLSLLVRSKLYVLSNKEELPQTTGLRAVMFSRSVATVPVAQVSGDMQINELATKLQDLLDRGFGESVETGKTRDRELFGLARTEMATGVTLDPSKVTGVDGKIGKIELKSPFSRMLFSH